MKTAVLADFTMGCQIARNSSEVDDRTYLVSTSRLYYQRNGDMQSGMTCNMKLTS